MLGLNNNDNRKSYLSARCYDQDALEPCFLPSKNLLSHANIYGVERIKAYLAHRIARKPSDLYSHTQRVRLHQLLGDTEGAYGALLDLFIVLGKNGRPLREHLFRKLQPDLCYKHYFTLLKYLDKPISATDHVPLARNSMLCFSVTGNITLVKREQPVSSEIYQDPLDEIRDLLNSGHISPAQSLLEQSLLAEPQRDDLSRELVTIYRHTRDKESFSSMLERFSGIPLAERSEWDNLALAFEEEY